MKTSLAGRTLLAAVASVAIATSSAKAQEGGIAVGAEAPSARVMTLDGKATELSSFYDGKPVVLEFWATWCPLCKQLEPTMKAARERHASDVNFVGVGVNPNQTVDTQRAFVEKQHLAGKYVFDAEGAAVKAFSVPHTSYVVVLDRNRRVVYTGVGGTQDIEAAIAKAGDGSMKKAGM
ncbi:MAG: TlpA disulfide reductase family protein [bacterium]